MSTKIKYVNGFEVSAKGLLEAVKELGYDNLFDYFEDNHDAVETVFDCIDFDTIKPEESNPDMHHFDADTEDDFDNDSDF